MYELEDAQLATFARPAPEPLVTRYFIVAIKEDAADRLFELMGTPGQADLMMACDRACEGCGDQVSLVVYGGTYEQHDNIWLCTGCADSKSGR